MRSSRRGARSARGRIAARGAPAPSGECPRAVRARLSPGSGVGAALAALAVPAVERIALEPLSEGEATQLLDDLDPRSISEIYRHGGGNPFYLELRASRRGGRSAALAELAAADGLVALDALLAVDLVRPASPLVRGRAAVAAGPADARGVDVRVSLASALRSVGELEPCREPPAIRSGRAPWPATRDPGASACARGRPRSR